MNEKTEFEESSGNVYADLNLPDAEELYLKATLGFEVFQIINERKLTQADAADILGVKQPDISRLKNGKFNHYSVERLFTFLKRLNRDIEIRILSAENRVGEQRVMKEQPLKHTASNQHDHEMFDEYDFSKGNRSKYTEGYHTDKTLIRLDSDVVELFHDTKSVNDAL